MKHAYKSALVRNDTHINMLTRHSRLPVACGICFTSNQPSSSPSVVNFYTESQSLRAELGQGNLGWSA